MNRRRRDFLIASATAGSLLGAACMTPAQQRQDTLLRLSREFNNDLRWGRYDVAAVHLPAAEAGHFLKRAELVGEDLVIADHEMTSIKLEDSGEQARSIAVFEWYTKWDPTLRKTSVSQDWAFADGRWQLIKQVRLRGPRFPLVLEPERSGDEVEGGKPGPAPPQ